jgi:hypothetical protein
MRQPYPTFGPLQWKNVYRAKIPTRLTISQRSDLKVALLIANRHGGRLPGLASTGLFPFVPNPIRVQSGPVCATAGAVIGYLLVSAQKPKEFYDAKAH